MPRTCQSPCDRVQLDNHAVKGEKLPKLFMTLFSRVLQSFVHQMFIAYGQKRLLSFGREFQAADPFVMLIRNAPQ